MPLALALPCVRILLACAAVLSLAFGSGCSRKGDAAKDGQKPKAIPVELGEAKLETVPLQVQAIGNMEAIHSVEVRSQVAGELRKVHFREGQDVRQGDLLFSIDPRQYQQAV